MEIVRTDRPPRVVDVTRSEPLSPNAAEIVRAEALPPRVVDAPRPEAAVGATSRAVIESTLSSPPPVPERAPASEPATPAAL
jgi:hypothetical protein